MQGFMLWKDCSNRLSMTCRAMLFPFGTQALDPLQYHTSAFVTVYLQRHHVSIASDAGIAKVDMRDTLDASLFQKCRDTSVQ